MDATLRPLPTPMGRRAAARHTLSLGTAAVWCGLVRPKLRAVAAPGHRTITVPLAALTAVSTLATVLAPVLGRWPMLLAMLSPRTPFLLLAAHSTPATLFVVLGTARACLADPFNYRLGRRLAAGGPPRGAFARAVQRWGTPGALLAVLIRPTGRHLCAAGAVRANPWLIAVADVTSTVAFLIVVRAGVSML